MNKKVFLITIIICILVLPSFASAALLGVNKVSMKFDNVLKQGYAQNSFIVSSGAPQDIMVYYEARGDIADWITFDPGDQPITLLGEGQSEIKVIVQPPEDIRSDVYTGKILVSTGALGEVTGNMGTNIVVAFEIFVSINITDTQILTCTSGGYDILDAEISRNLPFISTVINTGNVRLKPEYNIKVMDQNQEKIVENIVVNYENELLPTTSQKIELDVKNNLEPGQYWAFISAPQCGAGEDMLTFSVLDKGGISDSGELVRIENEPWAQTLDQVPIKVYFRNVGTRTVSAQFKGVASTGGKISKILESEIQNVDPDEVTVFEMFFEPKDLGQYKITGRVHYNNKITFEKGSILNVDKEGIEDIKKNNSSELMLSVVLSIIILIIGVLFFMIIKKKKNRRPF